MDAPFVSRGVPRLDRKCSLEDCERPHDSLGFCSIHAKRFRRGTDLSASIVVVDPARSCLVDDCPRSHSGNGYCDSHRKRANLYDDPTGGRPIRNDVHGEVTFAGAHRRPTKAWGPAKNYQCIDCGDPACHWAYDGTDPEQLFGTNANRTMMFYSRYPEFYMPMCAKCHKGRDGAAMSRELQEYRTLKHVTGLTYEEMAQKLGING